MEALSVILSTSHEIPQVIMKNLGFEDLVSASQVCQLWNRIAKKILEHERKPKYFLYHDFGANLCNRDVTDTNPLSLRGMVPVEKIQSFLDRLHTSSLPWIFLGFTKSEVHLTLESFPGQKRTAGKSCLLYDTLRSKLGKHSKGFLASTTGVIGTAQKSIAAADKDKNLKQITMEMLEDDSITDPIPCTTADDTTKSARKFLDYIDDVGYSFEIEDRVSDGFSILTFPAKQPGVQINVIDLDYKYFCNKYRRGEEPTNGNLTLSPEEFNSLCNLNPSDEVKAMLIFYNDPPCPLERAFKVAASKRENEKLAMGGGMVRSLSNTYGFSDEDTESRTSSAIIFSGKNIRAASIILSESIRTDSQVEEQFRKLEPFYKSGAQTLCFVSACCGRGENFYRSHLQRKNFNMLPSKYSNVEANCFRRIFPKIPLFGFFGDGEFGQEFIPKDDSDDLEPSQKRRKKKLHHSYTSIYVMVSIV